jgi:hypothetical protein
MATLLGWSSVSAASARPGSHSRLAEPPVDRVQNKLAKFVIGAVSGAVIVSLFSFGVRWTYQEVTQWLSDRQNIDHEEALKVARQYVGVNTVKAIPFRNERDDQQYIAVSTKLPEVGGPLCIGDTRLILPDDINAEDEFEDAVVCNLESDIE